MISMSYEQIIEKIHTEKGLSISDIEYSIKNKLRELGELVSKEGAAYIIANEHGVKIFEDFSKKTLKINQIMAGMSSVNIVGKVVQIYAIHEFNTGTRQGKVANLLIGDETGTIRLVMWDTNHIKELENNNLLPDGNFERGVTFTRGDSARDGGVHTIESIGNEKFLSLTSSSKQNAVATWQVLPFDPMANYYIEVRYKQIYGSNARVSVSQTGNNVVNRSQLETMPNYPEWRVFSFFYTPTQVKSRMDVRLQAAAVNDPLGTKILYDDIKVQKVFLNRLLLVENSKQVWQAPEKIARRRLRYSLKTTKDLMLKRSKSELSMMSKGKKRRRNT